MPIQVMNIIIIYERLIAKDNSNSRVSMRHIHNEIQKMKY